MTALPIIIGMGGVNAAGRTSFHQGFRRIVIDKLNAEARQETFVGLATLMNLLTSQECNQIIEMARPIIRKSTVLSDEGTHPGRTSSHVFLKTTTELLKRIDNIVFNYLQIPIENYEDLQVVNYKSTQKYDAHYDACDPDEEICKNE